MTPRRTTALTLGLLLGTAVAAMMLRVSPSFFALVRLQDDFSERTFMQDDPKEPIPTEDSNVVFFPAAEEGVVRTEEPVPDPPVVTKTPRPLDPVRLPRTREGSEKRAIFPGRGR